MSCYHTYRVLPVACFNYGSVCHRSRSRRKLITLDGSTRLHARRHTSAITGGRRVCVSQQDTTAQGLNDMDFGADYCEWNSIAAQFLCLHVLFCCLSSRAHGRVGWDGADSVGGVCISFLQSVSRPAFSCPPCTALKFYQGFLRHLFPTHPQLFSPSVFFGNPSKFVFPFAFRFVSHFMWANSQFLARARRFDGHTFGTTSHFAYGYMEVLVFLWSIYLFLVKGVVDVLQFSEPKGKVNQCFCLPFSIVPVKSECC